MLHRGFLLWAVVVLTLVGIAGAAWYRSSRPSGEALTMRVLASVDDRDLTVGRFNESFVQYLMASGRNDTPEERYRYLDRLLRDMILAGEARRIGLDQSPEFKSQVDRIRRLAVGARYFEDAFAQSQSPLTEVEVRAAYEKSRARVAIRHLYFRDPEAARAAWDALEAGLDFMDLARNLYGTAPDDSIAGYLGFASYWDLDDAVAEAAYDLEVGGYSEPVRSRYGWHVLRVEDRLDSPILTETDFMMHRSGIEGRALIRRNRLAGDAFVRDMMEGLNVQVDEAGARALVDAMTEAVVRPQSTDAAAQTRERAQVQITRAELEVLRERLEPGTVLATLDLDGTRAEFTAGDFIRWLPELPYEEVRDRTVSAVGRALRNEVLAQRGLKAGFEGEPLVTEAVRHASDTWLAASLREALRASKSIEPTEAEVGEAFERLGYRKLEAATADWWVVRVTSVSAADSVLKALSSGTDPSSFAGYEYVVAADILGDGLAGHVRRAPLDRTVAGCMGIDECFALRVLKRDLVYTRLEDKADDIRRVLATLLPEELLADSLLSKTEVRVDTLLFKSLMEPQAGGTR